MADSQSGVQLRQRGLALAGGGLLVQLIGSIIVVGSSGWAVIFLAVVVSAAASVLTYTKLKDHTGLSGAASVASVLLAILSSFFHPGWGGVLMLIVGAVVLHLGNKQIVAGIKF